MIKVPLNNHLLVIRFILTIGVVCFPVVGIVNFLTLSESNDPIIFRLIVSGLCGLLLLLSYSSSFIKTHITWGLYIVYFVLVFWIEYLLYTNQLSTHYAMTAFILFVGMSLGIQDRFHLKVYLIAFPLITAINAFQINDPEITPGYYVFLLSMLSLLTFFVIDNFLRYKEQLQHSNDNFRTLFNNINNSYFLLDKRFIITKMNRQSKSGRKKYLTEKPDLKEGDNILEAVPDNDIVNFRTNFTEALNGRDIQYEQKIATHGDDTLWYQFTFTPVIDQGGKVKGVLFSKEDITERKKSEEKIRKSEERYRLIAENSSDMISVHQKDGSIVYVSPSCKYVLGFEQDELISKIPFDAHHPHDAQKVRDAHDKLVSRPSVVSLEYRAQNKKGQYVWLESVLRSVPDEQTGGIKEIISTTREISERKMVEEEITRSEAQLKAIFNSVNLAVYTFDITHRLITFNNRFKKYIKILLKKDVQKGELIDQYIPSDLVNEIQAQHEKVIQGKIIHKDYSLHIKNYNDYWIEFFAYPLLEENTITGAIVLIRNITARKKAEIALAKSENWFRKLFNNAPNGMALADLQGNFVQVNRAFSDMFGYKMEEMVGRNFKDFSHADDIEINVISNQKLIDNQLSNYELEKRYIHKDGSTIYTILNVTILKDEEGAPHRLLGQAVDITERKQSENMLRKKNEELAKTNEELDRFVYSASHDLRSPLSSILGLINLSYTDIDSSERFKYLYYMEKSVRRLDRFIGDILSYSKNSRMEVNYDEVSISELTDHVLDSLSFMEDYKRVKFFKQIEVDKIVSDKRRIKIILNNLLTNAFRYNNPDAKHPFVALRVEQNNSGTVDISVEDNGIGIEEEQKDKVFEMFYRGTEKTQGSGLGLFIVKESVNKLGGEIILNTRVARGTCFTIKIPYPVQETIPSKS